MVLHVASAPISRVSLPSSTEAPSARPRSAKRSVSRRVVACVAAAGDVAIVAGAGVMPMVSMPVAVDAGWQVAVPSIVLGAVLAVNLMHLLGVYHFRVLGKLDVALGRSEIAWLVTMVAITGILHISGTVPTLKGW